MSCLFPHVNYCYQLYKVSKIFFLPAVLFFLLFDWEAKVNTGHLPINGQPHLLA